MLLHFTLYTGEDVFINPTRVAVVSPSTVRGNDGTATTCLDIAGGGRLYVLGEFYRVAHRISIHMEGHHGKSTEAD